MSNHNHELYTYMYYTPYKTENSPKRSNFLCYCAGRNPVKIPAAGKHEAKAKAAKHFKVGADKIRAVVPV
jgi:hypothetical protein